MPDGADPRLVLSDGDITLLDVDAIVDAANEHLIPGGGVDHAIHSAAGPELARAARALGGCPTGEARIAPGFRLRARWVIFTVGPIWRGGAHGEDELLASCYRTSLALAEAHGIASITFPAISTGIYGFPGDRAAAIAVRELRGGLRRRPSLDRVVVACFGSATRANYEAALRERA